MEPPPLIDTTDWTGYRVILLIRDWSHIRTRHRDLERKLGGEQAVFARIEESVQHPDEVRVVTQRPFVAYVYRRVSPHLYLRVIIWYVGGPAEVRSAHFQAKPRPTEVRIWP